MPLAIKTGFCRYLICRILVIFSLLTFSESYATRLQVTDISLPKQLRDRNIKQAVYDSRGLLWFFTNRDIYRYDGTNVVGLGTQLGIQPYSIKFIGTRQTLIRLNLNTWEPHSYALPSRPAILTPRQRPDI